MLPVRWVTLPVMPHAHQNTASQNAEFCADIEHNVVQKGSSCGSDVPALLTHGSIIAGKLDATKEKLESWHMLTTLEHFAVQGFHMFEPSVPSGAFGVSQGLKVILQSLTFKELATHGLG